MRTFKDPNGHEWRIVLTIGAVKRVKDELPGIDLLDPMARENEETPPLVMRLSIDDALFVGVLFALCDPQAQAEAISPIDFAELMDGQTVTAAQEAFAQEWTDFFLGRRKESHAVMVKGTFDLTRTTLDAASEKAGRIDFEGLKAEVRSAFARGKPSMPPPESSESNRGASPLVS